MFASIRPFRNAALIKITLLAALALALTAFPERAAEGAFRGMRLCAFSIIPSLFPYLAVSGRLFSLLSARFPKRSASFAVVFGFIGGYPASARFLGALVREKKLEPRAASMLLCGCVNAGPAFLIGSVGTGMFSSVFAGIALFVSASSASAALLLLFARGSLCALPSGARLEKPTGSEAPAPRGFTDAVSDAVSATFSICAYVLLFSCLLSLSELAVTRSGAPFIYGALRALCEVSGACGYFSGVGAERGLYWAAASVSLCGLSVYMQLRSLLSGSGVSLVPFALSRLLHLPLTLFFLKLLLAAFPSAASVFSDMSGAAVGAFSVSPIFSVFLFLSAAAFTAGSRKLSIY